jgi:hypothetical protein
MLSGPSLSRGERFVEVGCSWTRARREMGLSDPRRAQEDHVLLALDEAELVQALDLLALDRGLEGEVKLLESLDRRQA